MSDYPDYTDLVHIVGTDIMVAIDLQGAYIMMPVDIQAQYLTLEIDIVAQSIGNIAIDLAAQSMGDITVNIAAQDLANLTISINAQAVGVFLQADWAALQGTDKDLTAAGAVAAGGGSAFDLYVVPTGKTFFACHWGVINYEGAGGLSADLIELYSPTAEYKAVIGGTNGASQTFSKPIVFEAGHTVRVYIRNWGAQAYGMRAVVSGYEL